MEIMGRRQKHFPCIYRKSYSKSIKYSASILMDHPSEACGWFVILFLRAWLFKLN